MLEKLSHKVDEVRTLQSKLILLIGRPGVGKSALLRALAVQRGMFVLDAGMTFGARIALLPQRQRHLQASAVLREVANAHAKEDVLLLDNVEILFDRTLHLNPLDTLRRHAHARTVVATWPGEFSDGRLTYAALGHPEHQDYGTAGWVPFELE